MNIRLPSSQALDKAFAGKLKRTRAELTRALRLTKEYAESVRYHGRFSAYTKLYEDFRKALPDTFRWVQNCANTPHTKHIVSVALNEIAEGYGLELVSSEETKSGHALEYVNQGDPYVITVLRYCNTTNWFLGCWGDCVK